VLRALLHLAGEVKGRSDDEVGVGLPDRGARVESLEVDLGGGHGLLADAETLAEAVYLCGGGECMLVMRYRQWNVDGME
jgi:hypothetical protein